MSRLLLACCALAAGFDASPGRLARLVEAARGANADALVVVHDGQTVLERGADAQIPVRSITKVFTGLAIGWLIEDKKIPSLDTPLSTWFPSWSRGRKAKVTLRHVLGHTSGLERRDGDKDLVPQRNTVAYVLAMDVTDEPGTTWGYSNHAVQLLAAVVAQAAGEPLDAYVKRKLFDPLGITDYTWRRDPSGTTYAWAALSMTARDLARVGVFLCGEHPPAWLAEAVHPGPLPRYGLLLEIFAGGRAFGHTGSYGQILACLPAEHVVAVSLAGERGRAYPLVDLLLQALSPP